MSRQETVVLVVEDEPIILLDTIDMIERAGMTALRASNAVVALNLLEKHQNIQILFTDINLPGSMDGLALARKARELCPSIGLIVTSGYLLSNSISLPVGGIFIAKPYSETEVLGLFRSLLGKSALDAAKYASLP